MPELPVNPVTLILGLSTLIAFLLYLKEFYTNKKQAEQQKKIWQDARAKSVQYLAAAEMAEEKLVAISKYEADKLQAEFEDKLQKVAEGASSAITSAQAQLIDFMKDLQTKSAQFEEASRKTSEQRISDLFNRLETRLSDFLISTEQKTTTSIELELKASRQLIDTYKSQQLALIDENIIAMMEQTLNLVLSKKLSLKEQLDLVYEALEKAKVEKFIV